MQRKRISRGRETWSFKRDVYCVQARQALAVEKLSVNLITTVVLLERNSQRLLLRSRKQTSEAR